MASTTGKSAEYLRGKISELKASGKTESSSKELGKYVNALMVLEPDGYSPETVASAKAKLAATNAPPSFSNTDEVQNYLNGRQNDVYGNSVGAGAPTLDLSIEGAMDSARELLPTRQAPQAPSMLDTYNSMREQYGLDAVETELGDLKAQEEQLNAQFRVNKAGEIAKPVAMGVIEGRISEQERTFREDLDFVQRQISRKNDQLKTAYGVIDTIMNLTQKDFENARATYNDEFDAAYKMINIAQGIQKTNMDIYSQQQATARANAQIYVNLLSSGNMDLKNLPADAKVQLSKMELQAGLPLGFFSTIKKDPKADIISTTSNDGQIQVLMRNPDGSLSMQTYGTKNGGGTTQKDYEQGSENYRKAVNLITKDLSGVKGSDGYVSPTDYRNAKSEWVQAGFSAEDYDKSFKTFVNPNYARDYVATYQSY